MTEWFVSVELIWADDMKVGFIGVGNIGAPIAGQLLKAGHALVVHDLRRAAADELLAAGAKWSDSPAALAAECEVVATCLPGPAEMEEVCFGPGGPGKPGGIVEHLKPGALYIDHTTNAPTLVRRVHGVLAARGVAMLDAPVSGGMEGARTRDLLAMVGEVSRKCSSALGRSSMRSRSASSIPAAAAPDRSPRSCTIRQASRSIW
jgi:3-hydroxyisobutyrate dehydrogenase